MTTTTGLPVQLRLAGQAAAPDGPVDVSMMYVMHHAFRRDLRDFAAAVERTPVEAADTWQALADRWARFSAVLHHHHTGEDNGLWPALLERADADERQTLQAMEDEHGLVDPLLEACADGFVEQARRATADQRAALLVRVTAAGEQLGKHLAHEEADAMAVVQRRMTQAEWDAIGEEHFNKPLSLRELAFMVPWAAKGLPAKQRDDVFARAGGPFKALWLLTRGWFVRGEARAFRHVA